MDGILLLEWHGFFYLKRHGCIDITRANDGHIIFIHKSYNEIVDKILYLFAQNREKRKFHFLGGSFHFCFR